MSQAAVIVGASVAGVSAAQALRRAGFDGSLVLVGEEIEFPYDKPPLSKGLLAEPAGEDVTRLITAEQAASARIELMLGHPAERLDVAGSRLHLSGGEALHYDHLVLATGARARPSPWPVSRGLHVLRTLDDCRRLRADLQRGGDVVIVGGGFIGAEVASSARSFGLAVTIVDPLPAPMARVLGTEVGARFAALHHRHGTATRFGVGVDSVAGSAGDLVVALTDGTELRCATVVVGIGAQPNDNWLLGSGLRIEDGILCDEFGRAAGAPNIYAAGDVARLYRPERRQHVRAEHWTSAGEQARCVAHNIVHPDDLRAHGSVEYVWSDQYDWQIQVMGRPSESSRLSWIEDPSAADRHAALCADPDGTFRGAVTVNWPRASVETRRMLAAGADLDSVTARVRDLL